MKSIIKNKLLIIPSIFIILAIAVFSYVIIDNNHIGVQKGKQKVVKINTSSIPMQGSLSENLRNTDAIIVAKVTSSKTQDTNGIPFTDFNLEIKEKYKSKYELKGICISMEGGVINNTLYVNPDSKQLQIGDTYLLFLNKRYPDNPDSNQYCAAFGYVGIVKVKEQQKDGKQIYLGMSFNSKNRFEEKCINKNIEDALANELK